MINRLSPIYVLPLLGLGVLLGCGQESLSTPETSNPIPTTNVSLPALTLTVSGMS